MAKIKPFLLMFFCAYILAKILQGVFGLAPFNLGEPHLGALFFELAFSLLAWAVSAIVYVTVRDGIRAQGRNQKEEYDEIS